jgi:hypothetical protein
MDRGECWERKEGQVASGTELILLGINCGSVESNGWLFYGQARSSIKMCYSQDITDHLVLLTGLFYKRRRPRPEISRTLPKIPQL